MVITYKHGGDNQKLSTDKMLLMYTKSHRMPRVMFCVLQVLVSYQNLDQDSWEDDVNILFG